jgi:hypothetical protein
VGDDDMHNSEIYVNWLLQVFHLVHVFWVQMLCLSFSAASNMIE